MTAFKAPAPPMIQARHFGGANTPNALVIHGTVSPDTPGEARSIANWWHGPTSPDTSAHYVVDPNEVIQCVGDHSQAFHCGYNRNSIGIELADEEKGPASRWKDANSTAIINRAATLAAQLCLAYNIEVKRPSVAELKAKGPHGIYGHNDSRLAFGNTTHSDPLDFPWDEFLAKVKSEVTRLRGGATKRNRVEKFHHRVTAKKRANVKLLDAAEKHGRHGKVPKAISQIELAMAEVGALDYKKDSRVDDLVKLWKSKRVIDLQLLDAAITAGGAKRKRNLKQARTQIDAAIALVPAK